MEIKRQAQSASEWYQQLGWQPFPYQERTMQYFLEGYEGIVNAATGMGKTAALYLPVMASWMYRYPETYHKQRKNGLRLLWITPLRALAKDIEESLAGMTATLQVAWQVGKRTGDTPTKERERQKRTMPEVMVITPESLQLMLAMKNYHKLFEHLEVVVADEWHELVGTKRGVQVELALSRLRALRPELKTWGLSATIGNMEESREILLGPEHNPDKAVIIKGEAPKQTYVETILPETIEKFPWSGHLGIKLIEHIIPVIARSKTTLLFTNTRSQAEIWYQNLLVFYPELAGQMALHHGSLNQELRYWVENALHEERLKVVVCTSSLDLGVDFRPVETVIQVGSPKGVARFSQRAGRSGHQPGAVSAIYFVPTNSLELIEGAALKDALQQEIYEERVPYINPYDTLIQYLLTLAVAEGFRPWQIYEEVIRTYAFYELTRDEYQWILDFIEHGGQALQQYDEYNKVTVTEEGYYQIRDRRKATRQRLNVGTIVSDTALTVKFLKGKPLGTIEEAFLARLQEGEPFWFSGRNLELVRIQGMTAYVRQSRKQKSGKVPSWLGGRLPLSSQLADLIREKLYKAAHGQPEEPELQLLKPLFALQAEWSELPHTDNLLIEKFKSREGWHVLIYPFEGRYVHEGMAGLVAHRVSRIKRITVSMAMNDYGFELLSDQEIPIEEALSQDLFSEENLITDINETLNGTEMAKRRFRDIATISGLIFKGYPGKPASDKHLQSSSQLLFDVFQDYDPNNPLIQQAYEEVRQFQLEEIRLRQALQRIQGQHVVVTRPPRPTPFAFPIMVDRLRERMSNEKLMDRIEKMQLQLEKAAGG